VVGSTIGVKAAIIPMSLAGIRFFARLVENAIREIPRARLDVGLAAGASRLQVIRTIQLTEALPGIVAGLALNVIAMIEYSAIAGAIGGGGLGYLAINYGYEQFDAHIMVSCIAVLVLLNDPANTAQALWLLERGARSRSSRTPFRGRRPQRTSPPVPTTSTSSSSITARARARSAQSTP
jgi:ABC-type methionine transport system permease subunit